MMIKKCVLPWYNCTGWLGIKHQVSYWFMLLMAWWFQDALRIPSRRVLRDSKTHPLLMPSAGRFSSHLFILFNDMFVHLQVKWRTVSSFGTSQLSTFSTTWRRWASTPHKTCYKWWSLKSLPWATLAAGRTRVFPVIHALLTGSV